MAGSVSVRGWNGMITQRKPGQAGGKQEGMRRDEGFTNNTNQKAFSAV